MTEKKTKQIKGILLILLIAAAFTLATATAASAATSYTDITGWYRSVGTPYVKVKIGSDGGYIRYHAVGSSTWYRFTPSGVLKSVRTYKLSSVAKYKAVEVERRYKSGKIAESVTIR